MNSQLIGQILANPRRGCGCTAACLDPSLGKSLVKLMITIGLGMEGPGGREGTNGGQVLIRYPPAQKKSSNVAIPHLGSWGRCG